MKRGTSYWQVTMPLCAALAVFTAMSRAQDLSPANGEIADNEIKSVLTTGSLDPTETIEDSHVAVFPNTRPNAATPEIIRERYSNRGQKKVSGTVFVFFRSSSGAFCTFQGKLACHFIRPSIVP